MYNCTLDTLHTTLSEHGIAILQLLSNEDSDILVNSAVTFLESLGTGLDRNNHLTWTTDKTPTGPRWGMYQSIVSHSPFMWELRRLSSLVFQHLWGTQDLVYSLDGASVFPPKHSIIKRKTKDWAHLDQTVRGLKCYQGQVVLTDTTAAFRATPGSHLVHDEIMDTLGCNTKINWYKFKDNEIPLVQDITSRVTSDWQIPIRARKGSMILWDSRVIHSSCRQDPLSTLLDGMTSPFHDWRCVGYVCARPRNHYSKRNMKTLYRAVTEGRTTNHWGSKLFGQKARYSDSQSDSLVYMLDNPSLYMTQPYMQMMQPTFYNT